MQTVSHLNKVKIAGVVVLYNPPNNLIDNITSYVSQIDWLFVIDNSETSNVKIVNQILAIQKSSYHTKEKNEGIASALNWGASLAIEKNFDLLLTMDQDTALPAGIVNSFIEFWQKNKNQIAIVSPVHILSKPKQDGEFFEPVNFVMTSGNVLNLAAYKVAGRFLDTLFIDHVDHEYCMRLRRCGFEIYNSKEYLIKHELGYKKTKSFIFFRYTVHGHSPIRLYYMIRNGFYVSDLYPDEKSFNRLVIKTLLFEVVKSFLFYDEKFKSLKAIYTGWAHYKKGKLGRYAI